MTEYLVVPKDHAGLELDEFLALLYPDFNKGFLRREVRDGRVRVDGELARPSQRLRDGDVVGLEIDEDAVPASPLSAPAVPLTVLHEDDDLLVVDKPPGLASEPERWAKDKGSLVGSLLWLARSLAGSVDVARADVGDCESDLPFRPRLVHRLDKDTSGVVVAAKNLETERRLRGAFEAGTIEKEYLALVEGEHPLEDGAEEVIDLPLGPDGKRGSRQCADPKGKPARTRIQVEERFRGFTWLRCRPLTGRTHQIRVHLSETGFPLVVDPLYGRRVTLLLSEIKSGYRYKRGRPERPLCDRLTLHAARITVPQADGSRLTLEAPLPADLQRVLKQLSKVRPHSR